MKIVPFKNKHFIFHSFRILIALVFIISGIIKLLSAKDFISSINSFEVVPVSLQLPIGYLIIMLEIVLGVLILLNVKLNFSLKTIISILIIFTAFLIVKYSEGAEVSCGCFGDLSTGKISISNILRNLILIIVAIVVLSYNIKLGSKNKLQDTNKLVYNNFLFYGKTFFVVGLVFISVALAYQNRELKNKTAILLTEKNVINEGETATAFNAQDLNGNQLKMFNETTNNKKLLYIFSTHCKTCRINIPNWIDLTEQVNKKGIDIFAVSTDSLNLVREYIKTNPVNFSVYSSPDSLFREKYKAYLTPQTILINENNKIVKVWVGLVTSFQAYSIYNRLK